MSRKILKGAEAMAVAAKLAKPDVVPAFPITPSTTFPEKMSEYVACGELPNTEFVPVESEHSAMSAAIAASATGARTCTATSSQGLALMHEMLFVAAGMRLPIVMFNANRALSAPLNIWGDQQDSMSERDAGWIHFYGESAQEGLDLMLMAFRVAEDKRVLLPAMVGIDGFILTHTNEPVDVPEQKAVDDFLPSYSPEHCYLDPERPATVGAFAPPEFYMETRYAVDEALKEALGNAKIVAVIERSISLGYGGPIFAELAGAFINDQKRPLLKQFVIGLGGRDITLKDFDEIYGAAAADMKSGNVSGKVHWININKEALE